MWPVCKRTHCSPGLGSDAGAFACAECAHTVSVTAGRANRRPKSLCEVYPVTHVGLACRWCAGTTRAFAEQPACSAYLALGCLAQWREQQKVLSPHVGLLTADVEGTGACGMRPLMPELLLSYVQQ